jgi:uncharacterized circularly permuted ATP-grasp superfamily protein
VALKDGSLVVNSSQGGGTKDTWILEDDASAKATAATVASTEAASSASTQSQSQS